MNVKQVFVLEAGLEPAQPQWPKDFKSFVSTIRAFVGLRGFEPLQTEPKPVVLPLHHSPIIHRPSKATSTYISILTLGQFHESRIEGQ